MWNIRILILALFLSSFARGQFIINSYSYAPACGVGLFLDNAATPPPCEEADTSGWSATSVDAANVTISVEATDVQNGDDAILVTCDTDIGTAVDIEIALTGLTASTSYTIEFYFKRTSFGSVTMTPRLRSTKGWSANVAGTTTSTDTFVMTSLTGTTTGTTASATLALNTTFDAGEAVIIDNLTIN